MVSRTSWTTSAYGVVAGPVAVATGATLGSITGSNTGNVAWMLSVFVALAWAGARLAVMLLVNHDVDRASRGALRVAWGWTLVPYVFALTTPLYVGAWTISLLLLMYLLERQPLAGVDARRTVVWVAGFELAAALAVWVSGSLSYLVAAG